MKHTKKELIAAEDAYEATRFNAMRHGVLSRYTVLPWEDAEEYRAIHAALVAEHSPVGPTEEHLVEEIAGIVWRKRRLRLAEAAAHRRRFGDEVMHFAGTGTAAGNDVIDALVTTPADTDRKIATTKQVEKKTKRALGILLSQRKDAYEAALKELCENPQDWWPYMCEILKLVGDEKGKRPLHSNMDKDETPPKCDKDQDTFSVILRWFIETIMLPRFEDDKKKLANRPSIRVCVFGDTLDHDKLEKLSRYEVHLDRKLERMLAMLLRLQELRRSTVSPNGKTDLQSP